MNHRLLISVLSLACVLALSVSVASAAEPVDLSGRWHGSWVSCQNGHNGRLNATFCKVNENCYQVRFTGTFLLAIPFCFTTNMQVTGYEDGKVYLAGSENLPLFGTFHFTAVATPCEFIADYSSCDDRGQFRMCR